jgi:glycosyltransferase involved in cell wall biosynthesis
MRIILLGTRGFPNIQGGVEKHCEELAVHLAELGCEVIVLTRKPYVEKNLKEYKKVRLIALPALRQKSLEAPLHTFKGVFAAKRHKPDILHIHAIGPALFTPLARLLGMKVVMTSHGANYEHLKWGKFAWLVFRLGERLGVTYANAGITISQALADTIQRKYDRKFSVIPNGVRLPDIAKSENALKRFNLEKGKYLLSVGRFVPEKGFHDLIEGFNIFQSTSLDPQAKDYKLVIIGEADHPDKYSRSLEEMASTNPNLVMTGFLTGEPLHELYSHAGLFVLASYYEGMSIVLLEALSYGLSCIATDIAGNRSVGVLTEDRFFNAGDTGSLAAKIREFIHNPLREEEKALQLNRISEIYDWKRIAEQTLCVYNSVVSS